MKKLAFIVAVALGMLVPVAVLACAPGAKCLKAPVSSSTPSITKKAIGTGDALVPGSFQMIVNSRFYGLPMPEAGTFYVKHDGRALKVKQNGYVVMQDVTHLTNRAF